MALLQSQNIGGLAANGAIPKSSTVGSGLSLYSQPTLASNPISGANQTSTVSQGTTPGLISNTASSNTHTTTTNTSGATTTKPTPNKSVLAQQQQLNQQYGAGLVEDGLAGPKTSAAIAKYLSGSSPSTPSSTTSGILPTTSADKFDRTTGQPNSNYTDPNAPKPASLDVGGQIPGVLQAGQQTSNEAENQKKVADAGAVTQWENDIKNGVAVEDANKRLSDFRTAVAKKYGDIESQSIPLEFQQGREGALARQYASTDAALQSGVTNALANQGQQFGAAQTQAARNLSGAQSAYSGAQNQGARNLSASGQALDAVTPVSQFGVLTNPVTGQPINGQSAQDAAINGGTIQGLQSGAATAAATGGNISSQQQVQTAGYQSALQQGQNLQSQLTDLIKTFGLNPSDINAVNTGLQKIAANVSDPHYKQLQNYVNDIANTYAQILTPSGGSQTDSTRSIAASMLDATASGASILDTMKSLDNAAKAKIAGVSTTGTKPTSSVTGQIVQTKAGPININW